MQRRTHGSGSKCMQRPRAVSGAKLSVPLPVNLPSMKKVSVWPFRRSGTFASKGFRGSWKEVRVSSSSQEHAGNDPTTQLVPSGTGSSSWTKPDDAATSSSAGATAQPEQARQPSLTATATWASQPRSSNAAGPSGAWQGPTTQPSQQPVQHSRGFPPYPSERRLNPEEYPSLADTAKGAAAAGKGGKGSDHPQVG